MTEVETKVLLEIYIYDPYHGCAWTYGNLSGVFHDNDLDEISHGNRYGSQD